MALKNYVQLLNLREAFRRIMAGAPPRDEAGELTIEAKRFIHSMRWFCYADRSCSVINKAGQYDTHMTAVAEGRREVFIEIQRVMNISDTELKALTDPDEENPR